MHFLDKRIVALANLRCGPFRERHASSASWQYTKTLQLKSSATMGEHSYEEPPDLSTWTTDQLIARVISLEQRLKEQTAKCVEPYFSLLERY